MGEYILNPIKRIFMIIKEKILLSVISSDEFIKLAVDIKRRVVAAGCMFHIDCAEELVANGSHYLDIWGANIYPVDKKIEFDSLINIRPRAGNRSIEIQDQDIRQKMEDIIKEFLI